MEIIEGDIRITSVPAVTIGDQRLTDLVDKKAYGILSKAILELTKKVQEQREEILRLLTEVKNG